MLPCREQEARDALEDLGLTFEGTALLAATNCWRRVGGTWLMPACST